MKSHSRDLLIAGTLVATSLTMSGAESVAPTDTTSISDQQLEAVPGAQRNFISADQRIIIENTFTTEQDDLVRRGVIGIAATRLALVEGTDSTTCVEVAPGTQTFTIQSTNVDMGGFYCNGNNTIDVTAGFVDEVNAIADTAHLSATVILGLTISHELGHARRHAEYAGTSDKIRNRTVDDTRRLELQADCYAGDELARINPEVIPGVVDFYKSMRLPDPKHGTSAQRVQSFLSGTTGSDCQP